MPASSRALKGWQAVRMDFLNFITDSGTDICVNTYGSLKDSALLPAPGVEDVLKHVSEKSIKMNSYWRSPGSKYE
jgi:hypothetical protein